MPEPDYDRPRGAAAGTDPTVEGLLTREQLWEFDCQGFLNLEGFLEPGLLDEAIAAAQAFRKPGYMQLGQMLGRGPAFRRLVFHPKVVAISEQFYGPDWRVKGSVLVINPARVGGIEGFKWPAWHRDADHPSHSYYHLTWPAPLLQIRFFVALSDVKGADSGGLGFVPGSHRTRERWPYEGSRVNPRAWVAPPCRKGDCVIMHHALWHTALPNPSDSDRINFQVLTGPSWTRSSDAEQASPELLAGLTEEERKLLAPPKW